MDEEKVMVKLFWGSFEMRPAGLSTYMVWHHCEHLTMSRDEQLAYNKANHDDFCEIKYLPPVVKIEFSSSTEPSFWQKLKHSLGVGQWPLKNT